MVDVNNLRIGKWYKDGNILFMPKEKMDRHPFASSFGRYDDGAYDLLYLQDPRHMGYWIYKPSMIFEIHNKEYQDGTERHYLYHSDTENVIENKDITTPDVTDFRGIIESIFERDEEKTYWRKQK